MSDNNKNLKICLSFYKKANGVADEGFMLASSSVDSEKYLPKSEWIKHVTAHEKSGLSAKEFCKKNNLNYDQFGYHKRTKKGFNKSKKQLEEKLFSESLDRSILSNEGESLSLILKNGVQVVDITHNNISVCFSLLDRLL